MIPNSANIRSALSDDANTSSFTIDIDGTTFGTDKVVSSLEFVYRVNELYSASVDSLNFAVENADGATGTFIQLKAVDNTPVTVTADHDGEAATHFTGTLVSPYTIAESSGTVTFEAESFVEDAQFGVVLGDDSSIHPDARRQMIPEVYGKRVVKSECLGVYKPIQSNLVFEAIDVGNGLGVQEVMTDQSTYVDLEDPNDFEGATEIYIAGMRMLGSLTGNRFSFTTNNAEIHSRLAISTGDTWTLTLTDTSINLVGQYLIIGTIGNAVEAPTNWGAYCYDQEGAKCYLAAPPRYYGQPYDGDLTAFFASLGNYDNTLEVISTAGRPRSTWLPLSYRYAFNEAITYASAGVIETEVRPIYVSGIQSAYTLTSGFAYIPTPTTTFLVNARDDTVAVSNVYGIFDGEIKPISEHWYTIDLQDSDFGNAASIKFNRTPWLADRRWEERIFATVEADATEQSPYEAINTIVSRWLPSVSLTLNGTEPANLNVNFTISKTDDVFRVLSQIAFQGALGIRTNGSSIQATSRIYATQPEDLALTDSDVLYDSITDACVSIEDIDTEVTFKWRVDGYENDREYVYRNNIAEFGLRKETHDLWIYDREECVQAVGDYIGYLHSNMWRRRNLELTFSNLVLQPFDWMTYSEIPHEIIGQQISETDYKVGVELQVPIQQGSDTVDPQYWTMAAVSAPIAYQAETRHRRFYLQYQNGDTSRLDDPFVDDFEFEDDQLDDILTLQIDLLNQNTEEDVNFIIRLLRNGFPDTRQSGRSTTCEIELQGPSTLDDDSDLTITDGVSNFLRTISGALGDNRLVVTHPAYGSAAVLVTHINAEIVTGPALTVSNTILSVGASGTVSVNVGVLNGPPNTDVTVTWFDSLAQSATISLNGDGDGSQSVTINLGSPGTYEQGQTVRFTVNDIGSQNVYVMWGVNPVTTQYEPLFAGDLPVDTIGKKVLLYNFDTNGAGDPERLVWEDYNALALLGSGSNVGDVLKWSGSNWSIGQLKPDELEITQGTLAAGRVLRAYDAGMGVIRWEYVDGTALGGASALNDLTDVNIGPLVDNNILRYNQSAGEWINEVLTLPTLSDVNITSITDGQILEWDTTSSRWINVAKPVSGATSLVGLSDVTFSTGPFANQVLQYDGGTWRNQDLTIPSNLNSLSDVILSSPSDDQFLRYNGTFWVNETVAFVPPSRSISTGTGLTGGGDLSSNRTISLSAALNNLSDVTFSTGPFANQVLQYDGSAWRNQDLSIPSNLNSLLDVTISSPANEDFLRYNGSEWINESLSFVPTVRRVDAGTGLSGGGDLSSDRTISLAAALNNLTDVNVTTPAFGEVLVYTDDGLGAGQDGWINTTFDWAQLSGDFAYASYSGRDIVAPVDTDFGIGAISGTGILLIGEDNKVVFKTEGSYASDTHDGLELYYDSTDDALLLKNTANEDVLKYDETEDVLTISKHMQVKTLAYGADTVYTTTIDASAGCIFTKSTGTNETVPTPSNGVEGQHIQVIITATANDVVVTGPGTNSGSTTLANTEACIVSMVYVNATWYSVVTGAMT